jgi:SAM-dependent methyltransferase
VLAVEPDPKMRALIPAAAEVKAGTAEEIPFPDRSVAVVFCGESFHWFDWPRAILELARVLEARGGLVLMWNRPPVGQLHSAEWPPRVGELLDGLGDPSPPERRYESYAWRDALEGSPFEPLRSAVVPNGGEIEREALLARISSWSPVAALPEAEHEAFVTELAGALTAPSYRATLQTYVHWTRLA